MTCSIPYDGETIVTASKDQTPVAGSAELAPLHRCVDLEKMDGEDQWHS
jgi:hypothetical protein